ncbi:Cof-type HAD-IIB family hydrolase [Heyndrickxia camelliae]|uniref:Cof-type HAD-IIB family hydrolase n=1 Tax=Heyndrickxia camelliae TaxID=1707093 RepID=A0A2N3LJH3_9BACI|nr:Cof-type HAD-IIB family hydrolase [Heyndrickxia camelliae]PKR84746.1 Cof-type HAD-IIB family hydrolase [Heyndrickxia camelliae]
MIRCIASDMDGTLLNARQEISELNRKALLIAQEQGMEIVIATGRSYDEAHYLLEDAGITCPIIAVNGAEIRNEVGDIVKSIGLSGEQGATIAKILSEIGVYFEIYTNNGKFTEDYDKSISVIVDIYKTANPERPTEEIRQMVENRFTNGFIQTIDDYEALFKNPEYIFYKFIVFTNDEILLEKASMALHEIEGLKVTSSGHNNLEVNHIDAQKGIALEAFVKERGIELEETMAIGDNLNDLSMLKKVGYSFAMGNAEDEVKHICKYQADKNVNDGVGKAIAQMLKISL